MSSALMSRRRGLMARRTAYSPAVPIAPATDQPVITTAACGASVLHSPTIGASSVGFMREKRTGAAEAAAGVAQSTTTPLDITGSTHYRYPMADSTFFSPTASNAGAYMSGAYKPGSSATVTNSIYQFNVEFVTSSPQVAIRTNAVANNFRVGRIYVNGAVVSKTVLTTSGTSAGTGYEVVLTFPSAAVRTIKIIGFNNEEGRFGGVDVAAGYTVLKPTAPVDPIIMFIGDSYVQGAQGVSTMETWIWEFAETLGFTNVMSDGVGSTGFVTDTGGLDNSYDTRTPDIAKVSPQTLVIAGGRNDGSSAAVQAALDAILAAAISVPKVYVLPTTADSQTSVNSQLAAGAAARQRAYIGGFSIDAIPKGVDGVHMTLAGHSTYAQSALARILATTWLNHNVIPKNTGSNLAQTYNFGFRPTAGSLLVLLANGPVTWTTPSGWTLLQHLAGTGQYVFTKTATTSDISVTVDHNGTGGAAYPPVAEVWEFPAGSTITTPAASQPNSNTGSLPALTGLTGTNSIFWHVRNNFGGAASSVYGLSISSGTPLMLIRQDGTSDGSVWATNYLDGSTASSAPATTFANTGSSSAAVAEALTWAVKVP